MPTLVIPSVNQPLQSILLNSTTSSIPTTTENTHQRATPSTLGPAHQTPRPRLRIAIPDELRHATGQGSRHPRQRRGGSPPPPPPPPNNTPTVRFGTEPPGPAARRQQRALQRLSTNGALRPAPRPRRHQRANRAAELELENAAANRANREDEDARRATAELEHAMLNDPYVWSRSSYPANWEEYNDRVQHSEEPWGLAVRA